MITSIADFPTIYCQTCGHALEITVTVEGLTLTYYYQCWHCFTSFSETSTVASTVTSTRHINNTTRSLNHG